MLDPISRCFGLETARALRNKGGKVFTNCAVRGLETSGGKISAVSAAEIYFRRPPQAPQKTEYASLYNPFWQVRLVNPTLIERAAAELNYVKN